MHLFRFCRLLGGKWLLRRSRTRSGAVMWTIYSIIALFLLLNSDIIDAKRILRELKLLRHFNAHENIITLLDIMTTPPNTVDFQVFLWDMTRIYVSLKKLFLWSFPLKRIFTLWQIWWKATWSALLIRSSPSRISTSSSSCTRWASRRVPRHWMNADQLLLFYSYCADLNMYIAPMFCTVIWSHRIFWSMRTVIWPFVTSVCLGMAVVLLSTVAVLYLYLNCNEW